MVGPGTASVVGSVGTGGAGGGDRGRGKRIVIVECGRPAVAGYIQTCKERQIYTKYIEARDDIKCTCYG